MPKAAQVAMAKKAAEKLKAANASRKSSFPPNTEPVLRSMSLPRDPRTRVHGDRHGDEDPDAPKNKRSFAAANAARKSKNPPLPAAIEVTDSQVRLISKAEVIERTSLTFVSIWRQMVAGTFPPARKVGGKSLWIEAEIEAWIKALPVREYKPTEAAP